MDDKSFLEAIKAFEAANLTTEGVGSDVCNVYKKVKPILTGVLPFLKLIPVYGKAVAEAITVLMSALDSLCKAS